MNMCICLQEASSKLLVHQHGNYVRQRLLELIEQITDWYLMSEGSVVRKNRANVFRLTSRQCAMASLNFNWIINWEPLELVQENSGLSMSGENLPNS